MRYLITGLLFMSAVSTLPAQWLKIKTPGIPRKANGKPDLTAPVPRMPDGKPDLSGSGVRRTTRILSMSRPT